LCGFLGAIGLTVVAMGLCMSVLAMCWCHVLSISLSICVVFLSVSFAVHLVVYLFGLSAHLFVHLFVCFVLSGHLVSRMCECRVVPQPKSASIPNPVKCSDVGFCLRFYEALGMDKYLSDIANGIAACFCLPFGLCQGILRHD
jgi:hypothetical protein